MSRNEIMLSIAMAFLFLAGSLTGVALSLVVAKVFQLESRLYILEQNPNVPISEEEFAKLQEELKAK